MERTLHPIVCVASQKLVVAQALQGYDGGTVLVDLEKAILLGRIRFRIRFCPNPIQTPLPERRFFNGLYHDHVLLNLNRKNFTH